MIFASYDSTGGYRIRPFTGALENTAPSFVIFCFFTGGGEGAGLGSEVNLEVETGLGKGCES